MANVDNTVHINLLTGNCYSDYI